MSPADFEQLVAKAFAAIPERFRARLDNVAICVEDAHDGEPDLLGLYEGVSLPRRGIEITGMLPDKITLFRRTILAHAADEGMDPYDAVRHTLIHEIGHHFGWDDEEIEERFEAKWDDGRG